MLKQGLLSWSSCRPLLPPIPPPCLHRNSPAVAAALESVDEKALTARERRKLKSERRESRPAYNWREEVEERLIKKPKKRYASWTEELNLDNLALLGPQWWVVRVSRVSGHDTAERLARSLARNFPSVDFKMYSPSVQVKRKLKNGSLSVKPKPLFPGCVFLRCVLNKEIHDFIRECVGVGGFIGSKVGNTKRQINKPRPVAEEDMEAIFVQAKEEQDKADKAFEEEQQGGEILNFEKLNIDSDLSSKDVMELKTANSTKRGKQSEKDGDGRLLRKGSSVQVVSGAFAGFSGILKKLDKKTGLATVGFTLFGKETLADLNINDIVADVS